MAGEHSHANVGVRRRTVLKGAAWSVPVVAVAAAVPMASASDGDVTATSAWYGCDDGAWQFGFTPKAGLTVQSVTVTSKFASGSLTSIGGNVYSWTPTGGKAHYSNKYAGCALDVLVADKTVFSVKLSDGSTQTLYATDFVGKFSSANPENCGTCGQVAPIIPSVDANGFCKHPGKPKYYHGVLTLENTTGTPIVVTLTDMDVNGVKRDAYFSVNGALVKSYTVPANTPVVLYVDSGEFDNSAGGVASYNYTYLYQGQTGEGSISAAIGSDNGLPPCSDPVKEKPPHGTSGPNL